jgi:hypothetical protein
VKRLALIPLSCLLPFVAMLTSSPWVASGFVLLPAIAGGFTYLAKREASLHRARVTTRNVDLSSLRRPVRPPSWSSLGVLRKLELAALVAGVAGLVVGWWLPVLGLVPVYGYGLVCSADLVVRLRKARRLDGADQVHDEVQRQINTYAPEVVLYFSGAPGTGYQVNMWLSMLERLEQRAMIVMRQPKMLTEVGETTTPVVCLRRAADLMNFALPTVRVVLYPANSGHNSHMLRMASAKHVFIGHGDSDKTPSVNPYTKVYDEVWVAGRAGRERYAVAATGVLDENIVEVGRPQLSGIRSGPTGSPEFTVLYAPTWEGWNTEMDESSVAVLGSGLVRALVEAGVRLIYKPHPLTGTRDSRAGAANKRIIRQLEPVHTSQVVLADGPSLIECFNQADLLITDVSSVIADFLASGRPYAVTNLRGLPDEEFRTQCPTSAAGYLLDPSCATLGAVLDLVRGGDPMAAARQKLRRQLLGPDEPDPMTRFNDAVEMLSKKAEP